MKKNFFLSVLFAIVSIVTFAQRSKATGASDPEAKKILDAVSSRFKGYKTVKAGFALKIESNGKVQGSKTGTLFMKGNKYRVNITGQEIFCDSKNIWTYDKSANEVQITQFENSPNSITPQKLFTNFYDRDFLYKLNDEKKVAGKTVQEIELTPVDKTRPFFKVIIQVNKATRNIVSTQVFEKNSNRYTYSITNFTPDTGVEDAQFVFDQRKYPGVEVIDLR